MSNLKEVKARSGMVIALATEGDEEIKEAADHVLYIPPAPEELSPILEIVPLQLLAYHIAVPGIWQSRSRWSDSRLFSVVLIRMQVTAARVCQRHFPSWCF